MCTHCHVFGGWFAWSACDGFVVVWPQQYVALHRGDKSRRVFLRVYYVDERCIECVGGYILQADGRKCGEVMKWCKKIKAVDVTRCDVCEETTVAQDNSRKCGCRFGWIEVAGKCQETRHLNFVGDYDGVVGNNSVEFLQSCIVNSRG